jgi:hypothetical protein
MGLCLGKCRPSGARKTRNAAKRVLLGAIGKLRRPDENVGKWAHHIRAVRTAHAV